MKLFICLFALAATVMSQSNLELIKSSSDQFTAKMFQEVIKTQPGKNVVLSAFSVLSPLATLGIASEGESHDEILKAIGLPNDNVTKEVFSEINKQLRSVKGVELSLANRVYIRNGEELNEQFAAVSRDVFNSDVQKIDFSLKEAAANEINAWVENNTNHRIKDLVSPDAIDASTAAILVNAIYFKGKWMKPFDKSSTEDRDFHVSKEKTIKIPTMYQSDEFRYGESTELDAKLLEMAYAEGESSLLIVLPNQIDGINSLVEKLKDPAVLSSARKNMYFNEVIVELPKFKIETTTDLGEVLKKMNVVKLFEPGQARLEKLLKGRSDLFISGAIQKAFIDVNEEGAEAAAANAFVGYGSSYLPKIKKNFKVDRPFYFALNIKGRTTFSGVFLQ